MFFCSFILSNVTCAGLDESAKIIESMDGWCRGYIVDVSKREEVYKAAEDIKANVGDVSTHVLKLSFHKEIQIKKIK